MRIYILLINSLPSGTDILCEVLMARLITIFRDSFKELGRNDPLRLAGATSFFTTFALPAVLLIILHVTRLVFSREESSRKLLKNLESFAGEESVSHITTVLRNFDRITQNPLAIILSVLFIFFVATTLFKVIKNSLNQIWNIRITRSLSLGFTIKNRLREFIVILSAAVLFLIVLLIEGVQAIATDELQENFAEAATIFSNSAGFIISVIAATLWFGLIFCYLPDGRIPLRTGFAGALVTSILFNAGKLLLRSILLNSNISVMFGKSSAIVLLLLFVFYTSFIFYFGAAYTKVLMKKKNITIKTLPHASLFTVEEKA